eukprot:scaffold15048_cov55-Attheya_sp.AAC.1
MNSRGSPWRSASEITRALPSPYDSSRIDSVDVLQKKIDPTIVNCTNSKNCVRQTSRSKNNNKQASKKTLKLSGSSTQIRMRFFQRIGVDCSSKQIINRAHKTSQQLRFSTLSNPCIVSEPLNDDYNWQEDEMGSLASTSCSSSTSSPSSQQQGNRRTVSFEESVSVLAIPKHDAYSDRIKSSLWTPKYERQANESRNAIEFASENWDWRRVAEDQDMLICIETGELIHPVHYIRYVESQRFSALQHRQRDALTNMSIQRRSQKCGST